MLTLIVLKIELSSFLYSYLAMCVCARACVFSSQILAHIRIKTKKTNCRVHACMLQLDDVMRIDRKIAQARYMYTYTFTFISLLHDDQSTEMQTKAFLSCFMSTYVRLSHLISLSLSL